MAASAVITLTTDFGHDDAFVGVMKGVILGINADARIVDLSHGIRSYDIRQAAFIIGDSWQYFPPGTIHLVIVDPGVGSSRRPIMVRADDHFFIGPDNGVFSDIYGRNAGRLEVIHITSGQYFLSGDSPTFQGRDVFAPVAGWLSTGLDTGRFGPPVSDYFRMLLPGPVISGGSAQGEVIYVDHFGNAITNITAGILDGLRSMNPPGLLSISLRGREVPLRRFYREAPSGHLSAVLNSSGRLEFFVCCGNASSEEGISVGDAVSVTVV